MRIVTRPDFDGVVCAVLLYESLDIDKPVKWVEPNAMQNRQVEILKGDIIANLAYHENCLLWFDHHESNRIDVEFEGSHKIAPSAAGVVFDYFTKVKYDKQPQSIATLIKGFKQDFIPLINAVDKIDSAQLSLDEVLHPEKCPYFLISMTISSGRWEDESYWNHLVNLLRVDDIEQVMKDPEVKQRCDVTLRENREYKSLLRDHTIVKKHVSITDFRSLSKIPSGNRFLVFSLYPESAVNVKIRYHNKDKEKIIVSVGHSIFNNRCNVNSGSLCSQFGGGGHHGAGSCSFHHDKAEQNIAAILETLLKN
jgi:oligoribonuclease NrnB/cAMP/cGMP phosphodiesterase (DHH superfamily)